MGQSDKTSQKCDISILEEDTFRKQEWANGFLQLVARATSNSLF